LELLAGSRIAAETFDDEVALVLRTHRAIPRKASAIVAATSGVIIPLAAAPEALDGYVQVTANIQRLRDALDLPIRIVAVVQPDSISVCALREMCLPPPAGSATAP
jgi:hypothetical protein